MGIKSQNTLAECVSLKTLVLTAIAILVAIQPSKAENVLLIIADDLGADSFGLSSTAEDTPPTPTINNLATNGVHFTHCWANPTCSPTRASILTGRHGFRTGVGHAGQPINKREGTIADAFSNAGYATACIGKWHLQNGANGGVDNPNLMGFDHFEGSLSGGGLDDYFNWTKTTNGASETVGTYATTENVNDAIEWIGNQQDKWFMWLAFNAPHAPFHLPPEDLHDYDDLPNTAEHIAANSRSYYNAMIQAMDTEIGRLLQGIDPDVLANTTIIFVGDNGTPNKVSPGVVVGAKSLLTEGGVHVPCIVSGPAVTGQLPRTHNANIHMVDLFNTMLEIVQIDPTQVTQGGAGTDSRSFEKYLSNPSLESTHHHQFTERFGSKNTALDGKAIGNYEYKLIRYDSGDELLLSYTDENVNLLDGDLTQDEQDNYDELKEKMDELLASASTLIAFESFESNWGSFTPEEGLKRPRLHATDAQRSAKLQSALSFETTNGIDVGGYTQIEVYMNFTFAGMDAGEGFDVQYFDGQQWNLVAHFSADDYDDLTTFPAWIIISSDDYDFPVDAKIRFQSVANKKNDNTFIDELLIRARQTLPPS